MDLEFAFDLLAALLAEPPSSVHVNEQELAAERERERLANEARLQAIERRDEERYEAQLRAIERQRQAFADAAHQQNEAAREVLNAQIESIRTTAKAVLREAAAAGSSFLSDYANAAYRRKLFETLAAQRTRVADEAQAILDEADSAGAAQEKIHALEARIHRLRQTWDQLNALLAGTGEEEKSAAERSARFRAWLTQLETDAGAIREKISIFPDETPEDRHAAKARAMIQALQNIEQYLYGPSAFYLTAAQRADVARLYGVHEGADTPAIPEEEIAERNLRFDASIRRGLDRRIFEMRTKLRRAQERCARMCARLGVRERPFAGESLDAQELLEAMNEQIEGMERRFAARARREVVQAVVDRAIRSARRGLSVRQLSETETDAGNWSAVYQLGHSGTTLEVYADARGQISIEAGGLLEGGSAEPTAAQSAAITRNNRRFCDSELPDIVERLREELEAAGESGKVSVREVDGPGRVRVFRAADAKNAIVLRTDGSAAAAGSAHGPAVQHTKYVEADS